MLSPRRFFIRPVLLLGAAGIAMAGSKISPDMPASTSTGLIDVIVQFKTPPSQTQLKQLAPFGQLRSQLTSINGIHLTLPVFLVQALASSPFLTNIAYITPDRQLSRSLDITDQSVNANLAWPSGWDGSGIGVAVIDSGVANKADLLAANGASSRVVYNQSFVPGLDASDQYGHGTHVAGILGANGKASTGTGFTRTLKGIAPNANIVNLRVLDQNGNGQESWVIAAIDQAIALKSQYNIRVINLSLGHPVYESYALDPLCQAVEAAWKAGIVVVVAAGNYGRDNSLNTHGYASIASPANDPYVITVGAMNAHGTTYRTDDTPASYSSKGPTLLDHILKPDLVAPGNGIVSLLASPQCTLAASHPATLISKSYYQAGATGVSSDYFKLSGTSMATPVVSGAAALMLQKTPSLTPDQVKARLMKSAWKAVPLYSTAVGALSGAAYSGQSDIFTVGAGYVDVNAALANTDSGTLPALSPAVANAVGGGPVIVSNLGLIWGSTIVWGNGIVWGNNVLLAGTSVIWGNSVVWGNFTLDGFAVIWGNKTSLATLMQAASADDGDQ